MSTTGRKSAKCEVLSAEFGFALSTIFVVCVNLIIIYYKLKLRSPLPVAEALAGRMLIRSTVK